MQIENKPLIGQILVKENIVSADNLEKGLYLQKNTGDFICATLVKLGVSDKEKTFLALSRQLTIPYANLANNSVNPKALEKVAVNIASHYRIMPVEIRDDTLYVAMADPLDTCLQDDLRLLINAEIRPLLSMEEDIFEAIRKYYGVGAETIEKIITNGLAAKEHNSENKKIEDTSLASEDASIIKFVNQILQEAVHERATDIHFEPFQDELRIRFRIDGILYEINVPDSIKHFHSTIVSRIKIMAQMNIAEHRLPQDGRIKIKAEGEELDLRVSVLPTSFGEAVHIRRLSSRFFLELEKLGLAEGNLKLIEMVIQKPHGVIFVTGPTGSGKSTTLYAALSRINSKAIKIINIEDPIEYQLHGVNQLQVNPQIGFTFATALRHMLRHDPDVMMVGEVRDYETAEITIRAALTGHLVFSTLHTNDAAGAVTRLLDMGIEPFLVSSSLECLVAQRLVRVICPKCKEEISSAKKQEFIRQTKGIKMDLADTPLYEGRGCKDCRFSGYRGRTGIHEILMVNETIREMIIARASAQAIKQRAMSDGMRTLHYDGMQKVLAGITTFSEVIRVTQEDSE